MFLYHYCDVFKEELFVPLMRGMANVTMSLKALEELEIPLPPIEVQRALIKKIDNVQNLRSEVEKQLEMLSLLKEFIIREIVNGQSKL
ncbi:MAG: restriction endonuclease subunit S [Saprospiraceae bacterium]|nr:restriction endonuclease subunit S [Saprospiraceae bacterium]